MARRRSAPAKGWPEGWVISHELAVPGKRYALVPGREFKVSGERGATFRFHRFTEAPGGAWITAYGGAYGVESWRSFAPERVSKILKNISRK